MNIELSLLIKKQTDTLIQQTKSRLQGTLDFKMNKQMETFSFSPPINLVEEGKWSLPVTSFETTKSLCSITDENNSFSISTLSCWSPEDGEELNNTLSKLDLETISNYM